jgi:hypothetical protein
MSPASMFPRLFENSKKKTRTGQWLRLCTMLLAGVCSDSNSVFFLKQYMPDNVLGFSKKKVFNSLIFNPRVAL